MAVVKRIEGSTVHKIQSGQVVVDLCSAVKELLENSIDAGSTSIDIRFKNYGLDAIEVQDNGSGIAKDDFESIALKHYTSKLSTYDDLDSLKTYGFRGEALSSLCAVSDLHITTARQDEAPQGSRLDFELSGKLKSTSIVACQRGTTVYIENLFRNLIVRRKELEKNIKREYTKVLNLLQAYACVCIGIRLSVSNTIAKQRKDVFRTKGSESTRDNIANVFGAKTLAGLITLDLKFEMVAGDASLADKADNIVQVLGHVSTPIFGGGRQTSDRQMFFVNSRPCSLPQFAKVFNEVYKSYNMSQSPFVFANILLNTNSYDVNVSPDKRTIMLHDQTTMLDSVRSALMELFDSQQQSVPQAMADKKLPSYRPLTISRETTLKESSATSETPNRRTIQDQNSDDEDPGPTQKSIHLISDFAARSTRLRPEPKYIPARPTEKQLAIMKLAEERQGQSGYDEFDDVYDIPQTTRQQENNVDMEVDSDEHTTTEPSENRGAAAHVRAFNERLAEIQAKDQAARAEQSLQQRERSETSTNTKILEESIPSLTTTSIKDTLGALPNAFDRIRPMRLPAETAMITVGDKTMTAVIGSQQPMRIRTHPSRHLKKGSRTLSSSLKSFMAPGTQNHGESSDEEDESIKETHPEDSLLKFPRQQVVTGFNPHILENETSLRTANTSHSDNLRQRERSTGSVASNDMNSASQHTVEEEEIEDLSDREYVDEETKKVREAARVSSLIEEAEARSVIPTKESISRAENLLADRNRDSTVRLRLKVAQSFGSIAKQFSICGHDRTDERTINSQGESTDINDPSAEARLSVTVTKSDFSKMRIVGQFNLGFIIAVRPHIPSAHDNSDDEIFIIDQHASDEKYNFERLQETTTLQNQRLVQAQVLDLTAVEEEILTNNTTALQANGFQISIDESGAAPVGRRCTLHALPTSREVTFTTTDLEELLALLAVSEDNEIIPTSTFSHEGRFIPRPSKVRKLFAMRACRSSIMIGKTLTKSQMIKLVQNMGTIDKPWNCPHGRPTMRHLRTLNGVKEWMGQDEDMNDDEAIDWESWL